VSYVAAMHKNCVECHEKEAEKADRPELPECSTCHRSLTPRVADTRIVSAGTAPTHGRALK
jgi:hypothetical protein